MVPQDIFAVALLTLLGLVLGGGVLMVILVQRHMRSRRKLLATEEEQAELAQEFSYFGIAPYNPLHVRRPSRWLAIRSRDTLSVQAAFRLNNPRPCSWAEGVFSSRKIFIAPPVNGWTLVLGVGLPNPNNDVDVCYLFLRELSRRLGHVQFFQADELLQHHAWAQVESGRVLRGYAWAGTTIWNQGVKTGDEVALGMNCFCYGENPGSDDLAVADHIVANLEKVPKLARRWSLDPAEIDLRMVANQSGITGTAAGDF
ncbi:MAG: hypothetical protein DVB33_04720 [Verrucomicrobia bacterium]|jgi:hypothetical protein|nr:MAG: hypothetical protein DVB33_04720 [Verrucomicrobiota bacterium]